MIFLSPDEAVAAMEGLVAGLSLRRVLFCCLMGRFVRGGILERRLPAPAAKSLPRLSDGQVPGKRISQPLLGLGRREFSLLHVLHAGLAAAFQTAYCNKGVGTNVKSSPRGIKRFGGEAASAHGTRS